MVTAYKIRRKSSRKEKFGNNSVVVLLKNGHMFCTIFDPLLVAKLLQNTFEVVHLY